MNDEIGKAEVMISRSDEYDDDELRYGLVLTRMPRDHEWWHGHFVRSNLRYDCELLGRCTTMLFVVRKFGIGATPRSAEFFLTLDGEGIAEESVVRYTGDWGETDGTEQQKAAALRIRRTVVPLLHNDRQFQQSLWFVIKHSEYETVAYLEQMHRLAAPPLQPE